MSTTTATPRSERTAWPYVGLALCSLMFVLLIVGFVYAFWRRATPRTADLHEAVAKYPGDVRKLIERGDDLDPLDAEGNTPLMQAIRVYQPLIALDLISEGSDVNVVNEQGETALLIATFPGTALANAQVIEELLRAGAEPNVEAEDDVPSRTPLEGAVRAQSLQLVETLLAHGARVDVRSADESTPLHIASLDGSALIVEMLLAAGADIEARNENGNTPLHLAVAGGRDQTVELLLKAGASTEAVNLTDMVPLDLRGGRDDILDLFKKYEMRRKIEARFKSK